jgi:outer membrane protein assembly factor BamB
MNHLRTTVVALAVVVAGSAGVGAQRPDDGADWTAWRGPHRDGTAVGARPPALWPEALVRRWRVDAGLGYATPIVVGDRVYLFARQGDRESMSAFDAADGTLLWRMGYPATFTMNSGAARHGQGPKSTPAYADGRLFAIGMTGTITAFDAADGSIVWQYAGESIVPMYTTHAFSPLVDGSLVIFHLGGQDQGALTAFDVASGTVRWRWAGDGPAYGSPVLATIDGTRQIVTLTERRLIGIEAATGTLLWERPYTTPSVTNAQTPNILGNLVILGDAGHPLEAFAVSREGSAWTTSLAWQNGDVPMRLSSAVLAGES